MFSPIPLYLNYFSEYPYLFGFLSISVTVDKADSLEKLHDSKI